MEKQTPSWWSRNWITVTGLAVVLLTFFLFVIVRLSDEWNDGLVVWAQTLAGAGSATAAIAALRTAQSNREQSRETARAIAEATKPVLTVRLLPIPRNAANAVDRESDHYTLWVSNFSHFDVSHGKISWFLRDGTTGERSFNSIAARPGQTDQMPVVLEVGKSGPRPDLQIPLGEHQNRQAGNDRVELEYFGGFGSGGWVSEVKWVTTNMGTEGDPRWETQDWHRRATWRPGGQMPV